MKFVSLASFALATAAAFGAEAQFPPINLDFESGAAGWEVPSSLWRVEVGAGRGGSAGLVWENPNPKAYTFPKLPFAVEPGTIYRYGAWVKIDDPGGKGSVANPKVSIDYVDAGGEWIGAEYAKPAGDPDPDGWTWYEGETAPAPAEAVGGHLLGFVARGGSGRVRFDGFALEKVGRCVVDALVSSAYRDEAVSGAVTFMATVFPAVTAAEAIFSFVLADGSRREFPPDALDALHASITIDAGLLATGTHDVGFCLRDQGGKELGRMSIPFTRGVVARRVAFDRFGRTTVGGEPFFPLGCYARDVTPEAIALYTRDGAPYNCIMPYHAPGGEMLDLCEANGIKVVMSVKDLVFGAQFAKPPHRDSREASLDAIAALAYEAKGHPAVLTWYANDEAPPRQAGILRNVRAMLHDIDPDHPVWHVTDKGYKIRPMLGAFDVIGMDPYPVGVEFRLPERSSIGQASIAVAEARRMMFDATPLWEVVQAFDWKWDGRWKNESQRFPTREEISCMTWQAIAAGANGIFYYAFHRICMGAKGEERDDYLRRVADAAAEVKNMMPVLLSEPGPAILAVPEGMVCRTWRTAPGEIAILAANATREPVEGQVSISGGFAPQPISLPPLGHELLMTKQGEKQ